MLELKLTLLAQERMDGQKGNNHLGSLPSPTTNHDRVVRLGGLLGLKVLNIIES